MAQDTPKLFAGGCTAEKAHTWLQTVQLSWKWDAKVEEKLYRFGLSLTPGSEAAAWWSELKPAEKDTWEKVVVEFTKKWPAPLRVKPSPDSVIAELRENILPVELLGKQIEDDDGTLMQANVLWAQRGRKLISDIGDTGMLLKSDVRRTLPLELRRNLNDATLDTWEKFFSAVEGLSGDQMHDALEEYNRSTTLAAPPTPGRLSDTLGTALSFSSPARASARTPRNLTSSSRTSQPPAAPSGSAAPAQAPTTPQRSYEPRTSWQTRMLESDKTFGGSTVRPNAFTRGLEALAATESPLANKQRGGRFTPDATAKEVLKKLAASPRTFQDDANGQQRYTAAFAEWMTKNAGIPNPDYLTFPFTPGTLPVGSDECYRCGRDVPRPHISRTCKNPPVPVAEQGLRSTVNDMVREERRQREGIFQVEEVAPSDILAGLDWSQFDVGSGNGEEPTS